MTVHKGWRRIPAAKTHLSWRMVSVKLAVNFLKDCILLKKQATPLAWRTESTLMPQNFQNYIAGAWHDGETTIENINPSDLSDSIGHYAQANRRQLDNTLDAAASAQKLWAKTGLEARQSILMNIGNELMARATDFRRRAQTGVVTINLPTAGTDYHVPFGGRGSSSYGPREQGRYAEEFYTTVKTSYIAAGQPD